MISRLPSNQKPLDQYWSRDPAIKQPPEAPAKSADDADHERYAKELAEYTHQLDVARETGNWDELVLAGLQPTKFVMKPIGGSLYRKMLDRLESGRIGSGEFFAIAFRASVVSIENFDSKIKPVNHPELGAMASEDVINVLDAIDPSIVTELGSVAIKRAQGVSPKS